MGTLSHSEVEAERLASIVVGCGQLVLRRLGRGLTRSTYLRALVEELVRRRVPFQKDVRLPLVHRGVRQEGRHLIELCVFGCVLVDVVTVRDVGELHYVALRRRLRLTGIPVGLITSFGSARLVLSRVVVRQAGAFCLSPPTSKPPGNLPSAAGRLNPRVRQEFDDRISTGRGNDACRPSRRPGKHS